MRFARYNLALLRAFSFILHVLTTLPICPELPSARCRADKLSLTFFRRLSLCCTLCDLRARGVDGVSAESAGAVSGPCQVTGSLLSIRLGS